VAVASVCGFPLGATTTAAKVFEAREALAAGAREIDVVLNIGWALEERWGEVTAELRELAGAVHGEGGTLKVILECGLLNAPLKVEAARRAVEAGADFLKTSTGFLAGGATVEDVALLRRIAGSSAGVKASGGIRSLDQARTMLEAGADRLGTSSGVKIMEEARARRNG
jgi:deoxyribose-phosphate aldolase